MGCFKKGIVTSSVFCVIALWFLPGILWAESKTVFILTEPNLVPYQKAGSGIGKILQKYRTETKKDISVEVVDIKDKGFEQKITKVRPDLIITIGTDSTLRAKEFHHDVPIVFSLVLNPRMFSGDKARITGASLELSVEIQLNLTKKILPAVRNIGILYNPKNMESFVSDAVRAEQNFNVKIFPLQASTAVDAAKVVRDKLPGLDVVWLLPDSSVMTMDSLPFIIKTSHEKKVPLMGFAPYLVKAGALFSYAYDYEDVGQQAGELGVKVLAGEPVENIHVVSPRKLGFIVNKKVAQYLHIVIPQSVLKQADEIIE